MATVNEANGWDKRAAKYHHAPVRTDQVMKPNHYTQYDIEPITFIMRNKLPFWMGNVIKYVMRADTKNGVEDLRKAIRYIEMRINHLEGKEEL